MHLVCQLHRTAIASVRSCSCFYCYELLAAHNANVSSFVGSATAKAASTGQGVPLEDISDDEEDPFEAVSEEEDIDLEADSEEEEEEAEESDDIMPPKSRTPKKSTPSRKKAASTPGGDTTAEDLSAHMSAMNINNVPMFSMDFKLPFMLSVYNDALDQMVKLEMWVPILPKEFFVPDIIDGKRLRISIRIPDFFTDEACVIKSNRGVDGFNKNTHEAQSFKDQCEAVHAFYSMQHIIGKPQELGLPFTCEERIVFWEIQAYPNEEGTLTDDLGGVQFHGVLVVVCQKLRTKRKNTGGFRIIDATEPMATDDGDSAGVN